MNPKNIDDQKCLLWCVAIHQILKIYPNLNNPERLPKIIKKRMEKYNSKEINFPCGFSDIDKFEKNNNFSINIFGFDKEYNEIYPKRISKINCHKTLVNVLLIGDRSENKHFCLIQNLSRLISSQINKHKEKSHICYYCLQPFTHEKTLKEHLELCSKYKCGTIKFSYFEMIHDVPFAVYADFHVI